MLTNEQIESLFSFCKKHFVYYYDVQVELVDHLANAVEGEMKENPKISFELALEKVHQSFGIMGFAPLVAEKEKMAIKKGRILLWNLFKMQFKWPKILFFILITSLIFTIFSTDIFSIKWSFIVIINIGCFIDAYETIHLNRIITKTGKKFLTGEISQFAGLLWVPFYVFYYPQIFDKRFLSDITSASTIFEISVFLSLFIILLISVKQTVSCFKNNLFQTYPEVFHINSGENN
jgi:hypothetical protein